MDEKTIRRLLALAPGDRTDHILYQMLSPFFSGYWTFLRPGHKGIELADILFIWQDVCILFEAKTRARPGDSSEGWIRDRIREAISTLNERAEMLAGGNVTEIRNRWRGVLKWSDLGIRYYYGIVILQHQSEPFDPREIVPESFRESKMPIQVFSLYDFSYLIKVINTPIDLIVYYELRHAYGRKYLVKVHDEYETFKDILALWPELIKEKGSAVSEAILIEEQKFLFEILKVVVHAKNATEEGYKSYASSLLLDLAIASVSEKADQNGSGKYIGSKDHELLIKGVGCLAELSRQRRSIYGAQWLEQAYNCIRTNSMSYNSGFSPKRRRSYIFNAIPGDPARIGDILKHLNAEVMIRHGSIDSISLTATSTKIAATYLWLLSVSKREKVEDLNPEEILNSTVVYIET